jgi:transposase
MPKPYSQDLRDRVIDAVERGEMSRRAAARRYEISESVAWRSSGLNALSGMARERLSGTAATGRPS